MEETVVLLELVPLALGAMVAVEEIEGEDARDWLEDLVFNASVVEETVAVVLLFSIVLLSLVLLSLVLGAVVVLEEVAEDDTCCFRMVKGSVEKDGTESPCDIL